MEFKNVIGRCVNVHVTLNMDARSMDCAPSQKYRHNVLLLRPISGGLINSWPSTKAASEVYGHTKPGSGEPGVD